MFVNQIVVELLFAVVPHSMYVLQCAQQNKGMFVARQSSHSGGSLNLGMTTLHVRIRAACKATALLSAVISEIHIAPASTKGSHQAPVTLCYMSRSVCTLWQHPESDVPHYR